MRLLDYAASLVGIPYRWWDPAVSCCDTTGPFWAGAGGIGEVRLEEIQRGHLNCAGFLNVLCRRAGLKIPGAREAHFWAGGTGLWWQHFEESGRMEPYDPAANYPPGTILLRKYYSEEDQGHIAVIYAGGGDSSQIIHCWPEKGVVIEAPAADYYEAAVRGFLPT
jgi:hypothetical protein